MASSFVREAKKVLTAHHIGNMILSILFFALKIPPHVCDFVFGSVELCGLDRREHEILVFLGVIILWRKRKATNWMHYLSNIFLFFKMANVYLFLRAEPLVGTLYVVLCILHAVVLPEPAYVGPERVTYFAGPELYEEIQRNKRITWLVEFYTAWSPDCKHVSPVFAEISERFALPNFRFGKLDISKYPKEAERFRINIHPSSRQLPTISLFKDGKEVLRRPTIQNKRAVPFLFTLENCIFEFDLNNLHTECKSNMTKFDKDQLKEEDAKKNE